MRTIPGLTVRPLDLWVAAALAAVCLATLPFLDIPSTAGRPVDAAAYLLVALATLMTAFRTSRPRLALVAATAATATYLGLAYPYGPVMLSVALTVYSVGRRLALRAALPWAIVALAALLLHVPTHPGAIPLPGGLAPATAWVAVPFIAGTARRAVVAADVRERAERDRAVVAAERLRLAQEVHDVVGHGLAAIQMQADVALHLRHAKPEQALVALEAISRASADALAELRTTLATDAEAPDRQPMPGLARLDALCRRVEEAGVTVDVTVTGTPAALSPSADLAAYRLLQEALTNVVKHSAHPRAELSVAHEPGGVRIRVTNQHLDAGPPGEGLGLTGMRTRVTSAGGTFTARAVPGSGGGPGTFEVRAWLPAEQAPDPLARPARALPTSRDGGEGAP